MDSPPRTPSSPRSPWARRLLALGFGVALLGLVEVGLRLARVGGGARYRPPEVVQVVRDGQILGEFERPEVPHFVRERGPDGQEVVRTAPAYRDGYEGERSFRGTMRDLGFAPEPAVGVDRYFLLGESAALGLAPLGLARPEWMDVTLAGADPGFDRARALGRLEQMAGGMQILPPALTIAGLTEAALRSAGRPAEVLNVGVVADDSGRALALARELWAFRPRGLLVYLGNNESLALRDLLLGLDPPASAALRQGLRRVRLYGVLADLLSRSGATALVPRRSVTGSGAPTTPGEHTVAQWISAGRPLMDGDEPTDDLHRALVARFSTHMARLAREAAEHGVEVYLVPTAPHLGYQPFFKDLGPVWDPEAKRLSAAALARARAARARGDGEGAWAAAREAVRADPTRAEAHFALGMILADRGETDAALAALERALALDVVRARSLPAFSREAVALCAREGCHALDTHAAMKALARREGLGVYQRFWGDHEHLFPAGCAWVAEQFTRMILEDEHRKGDGPAAGPPAG